MNPLINYHMQACKVVTQGQTFIGTLATDSTLKAIRLIRTNNLDVIIRNWDYLIPLKKD